MRRFRNILGMVEAWMTLLAAHAGWLTPDLERRSDPLQPTRTVARLAWRVSRVSEALRMKNPCLKKATALQRLLLRRGVATRVRIGTRVRSGIVESHAWLELGGVVVMGNLPDLSTYDPMVKAQTFEAKGVG